MVAGNNKAHHTQVIAAGLNFSHSFETSSIALSLGMERGNNLGSGSDPEVMTGGLKVSAAGFTVGVAAGTKEGDGAADGTIVTAGVMYDAGAWALSVNYFSEDKDANDSGHSNVALQGKYILGPGVDVNSLVGAASVEDAQGASTDSSYAILGLRVVF